MRHQVSVFWVRPEAETPHNLAFKMKPKPDKRYAGLTLLGNSEAAFPKSPQQAQLETFSNPNLNRDYWIRLDCPEFTSLCPVTGQPDFAAILIDYVPDKLCVETKSLKLYLSSYRNVHSFNEQVVNRILDDLVRVCQPRKMRVPPRTEKPAVATGYLSLLTWVRVTVNARYRRDSSVGRDGM